MHKFYVYLHCKPDGTPFYVGKGCGPRCKTMYRPYNKHYQSIVEKYGKENIIVGVTYCVDEQEAFEQEVIHIQQLREDGVELCNYTDGGEGSSGHKKSEETKLKIRNSNLGQKRSDLTKARVKAARAKQVFSAETRKKFGERNTKTWTGRKRSAEEKEKNRQAHLGKPAWNKGKKWSDEARKNISAGIRAKNLRKLNGEHHGRTQASSTSRSTPHTTVPHQIPTSAVV